jgi:hypothetical protein
MSFIKRLLGYVILLCAAVISVLACNLTSNIPPTSTPPVPLGVDGPILNLNPVTGTIGSSITITGLGFPRDVSVNFYLSAQTVADTILLQTLTTDSSGTIKLNFQVPTQLNGISISSPVALKFILTAPGNGLIASAIFLVQDSTPGSASVQTGVPTTGSGAVQTLFIISAGTDSVLAGNVVTIIGSDTPGARVNVQVQDANNVILGSAVVTSQSGSNGLGVWQTTIAFNMPTTSTGYVVAFTSAQQSSIPITFASSATGTVPGTPVPTLQFIQATPN